MKQQKVKSAVIGLFVIMSGALYGAVVKPSLIVPQWSGAQPGSWTMDYRTALTNATQETRTTIMLFTGMWWCPYCQALEEKVLSQDGFKAYAAEKGFYLVAMDFPGRTDNYTCWLRQPDYLASNHLTVAEAEADLLMRYSVQTQFSVPGAAVQTALTNKYGITYARIGYPTMVIVRPDGRVSGRVSPDFTSVVYTSSNATEQLIRKLDQILLSDEQDEKDDYWQGATVLDTTHCENTLLEYGSRTLSETDAADWYAMESVAGKEWIVQVLASDTVESQDVRIDLFGTTGGVIAASSIISTNFVPGAATAVRWVPSEGGRVFIKVSRTQSITKPQGYRLLYGHRTPAATVSFVAPRYSIPNTALQVSLPISIRVKEPNAEVRVLFETKNLTAQAGVDYLPVQREITWRTDEPKTTKVVRVTIIQPSEWIGDRQFSASLTSIQNCAVGEELSLCTVTLTETRVRRGGSLSFGRETPASLLLREGDNASLSVVRSGGYDGMVTGRITLVQGSLVVATVTNLVWGHHDASTQQVEVAVAAQPGYQPDKVFTVKLVAAGGASLATPSVITLTQRDDLVVSTFASYVAGHPFWRLTTFGKPWFYGYYSDAERGEAWLRTVPVQGKGSAGIQCTPIGPGLMTFTSRYEGINGNIILSLTGKTVTNALDNGQHSLAIPAGSQTVMLSMMTGASAAGGMLGIKDLTFVPLLPLTNQLPLNRSACAGLSLFQWQTVWDPVRHPAWQYDIYAGLTLTGMKKINGTPLDATCSRFPREGNSDDEAAMTQLNSEARGKALYWRVDTVVIDAFGRRAVLSGAAWSVTVLPAGSPEYALTSLPPACVIERGEIVVPALTVGVRSEVGPFPLQNLSGVGRVRVSIANGTLPVGVTAIVREGAVWLTGAPLNAGSGMADLFLSEEIRQNLVTRLIRGISLRIRWTSQPLGRYAGSYQGYRVKQERPDCGDVTMSVTGLGAISGRFLYEGTRFVFASPAFSAKAGETSVIATNLTAKGENGKSCKVSFLVDLAVLPEARLVVEGDEESHFAIYRNNWIAGDPLIAGYVGSYALAFPVVESNVSVAPKGSGFLSVYIRNNGTISYAGLLADGKSVSGSTVLMYGPDCCSMEDRLSFYMLLKPSGYAEGTGLYGLVQVVPDATGNMQATTLRPAQEALYWVNTSPLSVHGYNPTQKTSLYDAPGFTNRVTARGGYSGKPQLLSAAYPVGTALQFVSPFEALPYYDGLNGTSGLALESGPVSERLPITVLDAYRLGLPTPFLVKQGLLVDCEASVNPWAVSVTYNAMTGLFTGFFHLYYNNNLIVPTQKTRAVTMKGLYLPVRENPSALPAWEGFYLLSDTMPYRTAAGALSSYSFQWSFPVQMKEAAR